MRASFAEAGRARAGRGRGRPETGRDKVIALVVFGAGLAAGLYNWYLIDLSFFGR